MATIISTAWTAWCSTTINCPLSVLFCLCESQATQSIVRSHLYAGPVCLTWQAEKWGLREPFAQNLPNLALRMPNSEWSIFPLEFLIECQLANTECMEWNAIFVAPSKSSSPYVDSLWILRNLSELRARSPAIFEQGTCNHRAVPGHPHAQWVYCFTLLPPPCHSLCVEFQNPIYQFPQLLVSLFLINFSHFCCYLCPAEFWSTRSFRAGNLCLLFLSKTPFQATWTENCSIEKTSGKLSFLSHSWMWQLWSNFQNRIFFWLWFQF